MEAREISETVPYMYDHLTYDRDGTDIIFQKVLMWKNLYPSCIFHPHTHTHQFQIDCKWKCEEQNIWKI